jgi:lipopolysaccharide export system protein LptA
MRRNAATVAAIFLALAVSHAALAQMQAQNPGPGNKQPIEITAQQTLEWHRSDLRYIARGDAIATQGPASIRAETLTADYRETKESKNDIYRMTAIDHVQVTDQGDTAEGDKAVYDVDKGEAVMTGQHLRMVTPDQTITARDRFEYWTNEGRLTAIGAVHVIHGEDTIDADTMSAFFDNSQTQGSAAAAKPAKAATGLPEQDQNGGRQLSRLTADGHVVIITPTEVLHGDHGTYDAKTTIAQLIGNVTIKRGPNILEGDHADINMTTNISTMHGGGSQNGGRVRGVFYPGSNNAVGNDQAAQKTGIERPMAETSSAAPPPETVPDDQPYKPAVLRLPAVAGKSVPRDSGTPSAVSPASGGSAEIP